jgi:hypothetical protein
MLTTSNAAQRMPRLLEGAERGRAGRGLGGGRSRPAWFAAAPRKAAQMAISA